MKIKPYMKALPFPDNRNETFETWADVGWYDESLDGKNQELGLFLGSRGHDTYVDKGILEWWVSGGIESKGGVFTDITFKPKHEKNITYLLKDLMGWWDEVPEYEIIWRNRHDEDESDVFITLKPLPADEEKLWKSYWENKRGDKSCSHENLSIKTMEVLNGELLLTLDCDKCGKRTSTSASLNQGWEAEDLNTWAQQELSSHGQNVSFKNWAKKEVKSHGNIDLVDWAKHEKQSHTKKYGAEYENIGTMQSSPASGYNGYMNMMSSARRIVEIGNETGLDQKLGEAYQDESGRWFLPILQRKASESFSLDSKKADSINMEEPVIEEPSFIPDGDGRAIGQQNSSINLSPLHAESFNASMTNTDLLEWCEDYLWQNDKKGYQEYHEVRRSYGFDAESRFDNLSNEIAEEYEEKGKSPEEAERIGDATAAMIGRKKYGKKGMAQMSKKGMSEAESGNLVDINYDAKIRLNNPKDAQYITPSIEEGMAFEKGEGVLSSNTKIDMNAEGDAATYSPSSSPDMVNEIQTSPTNESPQLFNASNTFNVTSALGISGLVVAALSLPMLYSSAKSRLGKSAEEKRKASGSVRRNHTQVKNSEYSVGQVNPVEAEGQQDIHGAEGITNPRHAPSASPAGYPSKSLKMW